MDMTLNQVKKMVEKKRNNTLTESENISVHSLYQNKIAFMPNKKKIPIEEKIQWAEKEYYIHLFLQPSEEEARSRIMWEYWGAPDRYLNELESLEYGVERLAYGSFFDRYNQPTFEEFKNGAPLNDEGYVYDELTTIF